MDIKEITSSYAKNNVATYFTEIIKSERPLVVVEFGVLNGYSTIAMALAMKENSIPGHIHAYDLWDKYTFNSANKESTQKNIEQFGVSEFVTLGDCDFVEWLSGPHAWDILHLDISNDGDKLLTAYETLKGYHANSGRLILFEGGTEERDEVAWMKKYNRRKMHPLKELGKVPYSIVCSEFPGLSCVRL